MARSEHGWYDPSPMGARVEEGPFRVDQIVEGSRYELSRGHPVYCAPAGRRHGAEHVFGSLAVGTDPGVAGSVGVDVGFTCDSQTLRAPDLAVGGFANEPGFAPGTPRLAIEYADRGTDHADLRRKIDEFLRAGTEAVWVVRLTGPRRVEVHTEAGGRPTRFDHDDELPAVGGLSGPIPVAALFDKERAEQVAFHNLLARHGYRSLDDVRSEAREEGRELARRPLLRLIALEAAARGLPLDEERSAQLAGSSVLELQAVVEAIDQGRWP